MNVKINRSRAKFILIISMILFSAMISTFSKVTPVSAVNRKKNIPDANVLIFSNTTTSALTVSLGLDNKIHYSVFANGVNTSEELHAINFTQVDVIIVDSYLPDNISDINFILSNINGSSGEKTGLIFFGGNYTTNAILKFDQILPIQFLINRDRLNSTLSNFFEDQTGNPINPLGTYYNEIYDKIQIYEIRHTEMQVSESRDEKALKSSEKSMYIKRIAWTSCPLLYDRIFTYNKKQGATTLVEYPTTREPIVVTWEYQNDPEIQVIYVSAGTQVLWQMNDKGVWELKKWNESFKYWPYFNYFMYLMVYDVKGLDESQIETYAEWPWSPIPHEAEAAAWMTFVAFLWVFNFALFFTLGKKKKKIDDRAKAERAEAAANEAREKAEEETSSEETGNADSSGTS